MDLGLQNKVIVCLSSAAGIGRGIATELAREGAKVVLTTAEPFKKDLRHQGSRQYRKADQRRGEGPGRHLRPGQPVPGPESRQV